METQSYDENGAGGAKKIVLWIIGALVIALAIWGMVKVAGKGLGTVAATEPVAILQSLTDHEHARGASAATAKVTLIEYSDFECPACFAYHDPIKALVDSYIASYGDKVRFVYRQFPLGQHQSARLAGIFAEAAAQQGKFWEMHDKLFDGQETWAPKPDQARDIFLGYASELGLNMARVNADIASSTLADSIEASRLGGVKYGVDHTPYFFVNDNRINDAGILKQFIDEELVRAGVTLESAPVTPVAETATTTK